MNSLIIDDQLNKLSSAFYRLKGIGEINPVDINNQEVRIEFKDWEWEIGVGLYGLWKLAEKSNDKAMINALANWYQAQIEKGLPEPQINSTAPMLTFILLAERLGKQSWIDIAENWADWIKDNLRRTELDGYQHVVIDRLNDQQLWDDTLFMTCLFMGVAGRVTDRQDLIDEAEYQFLLHIKYLSDNQTGLWYHGWTFNGRHNFAKALWGRGNSWYTTSSVEFITLMKGKINKSIEKLVISALNEQIKSLINYQSDSGLWHTLITDEYSPLESSATAGIAYGMLKAIRIGLIDENNKDAALSSALRATEAIINCIDETGIVLNASDGTAMGHDLQYYCDIPNTPVPYAQALAILLMVELKNQFQPISNQSVKEKVQ